MPSLLFSDNIKCAHCSKAIEGKYVIFDGENYHKECYEEHVIPKCSVCGKAIEGEYTFDQTGKYHPECYSAKVQIRCTVCSQVIDGKYNYDEKGKYHPECYREHVLPKCDICGRPLEGEYLVDPWGNQYHSEHKSEKGSCAVCGRILSKKTSAGRFQAGDRLICGLCNADGISNIGQAELSEIRVRELLAGQAGIRDLPERIELILLEEQRALNRVAGTGGDQLKGFTQYEARTLGSRRIGRTYKVYILSHLPRVVFDAVLAHELMHVYLFEHELDPPPNVTEGFCNLASALVYDNDRSALADYKLSTMQEDPDPDYGKGFRMMKNELSSKGWNKLLKDINTSYQK